MPPQRGRYLVMCLSRRAELPCSVRLEQLVQGRNMRIRTFAAAAAGVLMVLAAWVSDASAQRSLDFNKRLRGELVLLGEKSVGFLVDRDVISVGQTEEWFRSRAFTALHFQAERNDIH